MASRPSYSPLPIRDLLLLATVPPQPVSNPREGLTRRTNGHFFWIQEHMSLGDLEQLVLLAILRLHPEAYGISVQQEIAARARPDVTLGAVYSALTRLEQKGLVSTKTGPPTPVRGGRSKKLYVVTSAGRE